MGARELGFSASLVTGLMAGLAALSVASGEAAAAVTAASSVPAKVSVAGTGAATVSVTWRVVRQGLDLPDPGTVRSPSLRFMVGGATAATLSRAVSQALPGEAASETASIRETILIPEAVVYRAIKEGSPLRVVRAFDDGDGAATAELLVIPSGQGSAVLAVERVALSFDDDSRLRVLPKGSRLHVVAELKTQGIGRLEAQWEIADAATTRGAPVFHPLSLVRQGVAGGGRTVINSPLLPTGTEGTILVRLRVLDPELGFAAPTLQYYVTPGETGIAAPGGREVLLTAPGAGEPLTAQTRFAWSALAGTTVYQIAFYEVAAGAGGEPLAAAIVAGERSEATLEAFTLDQLPAGQSYLWRVLARDANGAVIGLSPTREIYKP